MEACLFMKLCMLEQMCHFYARGTSKKANNCLLPAFAMAEFFEKVGEKVETVVAECRVVIRKLYCQHFC